MPNNHSPLVSVIIPTYNRPDLLVRSINSVLCQTHPNLELVVVDDRSENDTNKNLVNDYAVRDPRVKYVRNDYHTKGIPGARNQGVDVAIGQYIAFLDDDDEWFPIHIKESVAELEKHRDIDWIFSRTEEIKNDKVAYTTDFSKSFKRYKITQRDDLFVLEHDHLFENFIQYPRSIFLGCSLIRRTVFEKLKFDETIKYMDDLLFKMEAVYHSLNLAYINSVHLRYYMHDRNSSNINPEKPAYERIKANEDMARFYERLFSKLQLKDDALRVVKRALADVYFWTLGYTYLQIDNPSKARAFLLKGFLLNPLKMKYWKTFLLRYIFRIPL